jgi:5-formyltetrahydrofolate cyclo-ligase
LKDTLSQTDPKAALRSEALTKRDAIPLPVRKIKDAAIAERLFASDKFASARAVMLYASFRSEVSTEAIILKTLEAGKKVVLPRVNSEESSLALYEIKTLDDLTPGYMGIPEPEAREESHVGIESVELVVVPGAAFDQRGYRLGYGKGYYDKLLANESTRPALVALAYEEQLVDEVPAEAHDVKMDAVITDRRIIGTEGSGNGQEED